MPTRIRQGQLALLPELMHQQIIALDGEGETILGKHRYTLLAASNLSGEYESWIEATELTADQCLSFLSSLPKGPLYVWFSFGYDVTMMLRKLPRNILQTLLQEKTVRYKKWQITYTPRKQLSIKDYEQQKTITTYDTFGFFQTSFVNALATWNVGTSDQVARIKAMKDQRGEFANVDKNQIRAYCLEECRLLCALLQRLRDALYRANIHPQRWDGAGAVAAAILRRENIKEYKKHPTTIIQDAMLASYFGGRFEIAATGGFSSVYGYDIRSAYPHHMRTLPCLAHGQWLHTSEWDKHYYGVWRVSWNVKNTLWPPFPVRLETKRILFPLRGDGWYHTTEIDAAKEIWGKAIKVHEGYVYKRGCDHIPFSFIPTLYDYRATLRAAKDDAHIAVKLGLNSLYGKTAQGKGWSLKNNIPTRPPYQMYAWAGAITAGTRAQLLRAIYSVDANKILSTATDGILSEVPLPLDTGTELGQWESSHYDTVRIYQSGVYETDHKRKTRGFSQSEVPFSHLWDAYSRDPLGSYSYETTRFISLTQGFHRIDGQIGEWLQMARLLDFRPSQPGRTMDQLEDRILLSPPRGPFQNHPYDPRTDYAESDTDD